MYPTVESAKRAAEAMSKKRGVHFSFYKCLYCDGYHIGKNRENKIEGYDKPIEKWLLTNFGVVRGLRDFANNLNKVIMEIDGYIPIDKAVKWLQNKVYGGFDSMCLDFGTKDECIETFINYQWHERPWLWEDFERLIRWRMVIFNRMDFKNC